MGGIQWVLLNMGDIVWVHLNMGALQYGDISTQVQFNCGAFNFGLNCLWVLLQIGATEQGAFQWVQFNMGAFHMEPRKNLQILKSGDKFQEKVGRQ